MNTLSEQKDALQNEIIAIKEENGTAKYVVTFCIKQTHFTLDLEEHLKDSMNEITIEIPVDKEYYDSVSIGINFRLVGSVLLFVKAKFTVKNPRNNILHVHNVSSYM